MTAQPKYKRILLKLSGEALQAADGILDFAFISRIAGVIGKCHEEGVAVAVLVGAGNIWRGRQGGSMDRARADHMGMLATTINSIALQDSFIEAGLSAHVLTAVTMEGFTERFDEEKANALLDAGEIVIFGAGLGIPFFSTDTAAAVRAAQIHADAVLMAKNVDGIYNKDPGKNPDAVRYDDVTYKEVIEKELKALDMTATVFCMENNIKCYAFELKNPENILRVVNGERIGTEIHA